MSKKTNKPKSAGRRLAPPNRRRSESRKIKWRPPHNPDAPETNIYVSIGYAEDGLTPVEIFYDSGYRSGSELETMISDLCIVLSIAIQYDGIGAEDFTKSISRERDLILGETRPGSLIGVLLDELTRPPSWAEAVLAARDADCAVQKPSPNGPAAP